MVLALLSFLPVSNPSTVKWGSVNLHLFYLGCEFLSSVYSQAGRTEVCIPKSPPAPPPQSQWPHKAKECLSLTLHIRHGSAEAPADHSRSGTGCGRLVFTQLPHSLQRWKGNVADNSVALISPSKVTSFPLKCCWLSCAAYTVTPDFRG